MTELPPLRAVVTEHRLHRVVCPGCGATTRATLPADVPAGAFGPRMQATVATLKGRSPRGHPALVSRGGRAL